MPFHFPWRHQSRLQHFLSSTRTLFQSSPIYHFQPESHHRHSRLSFPLQIFLLTLTSLGLITGAILIKRAEDLRRQAVKPQAIPMLVEFKLNPKTGQVKLNRAAKISHLSDRNQAKTPLSPTYTLEQRLNNRAINTTSLTFVTHRQNENFDQLLNLPNAPESDPREPLAEPIAITTIPYYPGSELILQSDTTKSSMSLDTQTLAVSLDTIPLFTPEKTPLQTTTSTPEVDPGTSPDATLDILFLSSNYTDAESALFASDAATMFEFLLTIPLFLPINPSFAIRLFSPPI